MHCLRRPSISDLHICSATSDFCSIQSLLFGAHVSPDATQDITFCITWDQRCIAAGSSRYPNENLQSHRPGMPLAGRWRERSARVFGCFGRRFQDMIILSISNGNRELNLSTGSKKCQESTCMSNRAKPDLR